MKPTASFLSTMLASLAIPLAVSAATWHVDANGSGDATTIQAGVDLASPGDVVVMSPGTYHEQVYFTTSNLRLVGSGGAEATIIDAEPMRYCVWANGATQTVLSGLTFTGARGGYDYDGQTSFGVRIADGSEVRDCVFRDNLCDAECAITGSGTLLVKDTRFEDNIGTYYYWPDPSCNAPCIRWNGDLTVDGCTFVGNSGTCYGAIIAGGYTIIRNSTFLENTAHPYYAGPALFTSTGGTWWIQGNLFVRNAGFPVLDPGGTSSTVWMLFNTFVDNDDPGQSHPIPALPGSIIRANAFISGDVGLHLPTGGGGIVVECNDSWGNAVNWAGHDPSGTNGNFSANPLFCDRSSDNFRVTGASPLLPFHNECGLFIGGVQDWCPVVSVEPMTWSRIKAQYR